MNELQIANKMVSNEFAYDTIILITLYMKILH